MKKILLISTIGIFMMVTLLVTACKMPAYNDEVVQPKEMDAQASNNESALTNEINTKEEDGQIGDEITLYEDDKIIPQEEDKILFRVGFYRDGPSIYWFTVTKNGICEASFGLMNNIGTIEEDLSNVMGTAYEKYSKQLAKSELDYLLEMADEIENTPGSQDLEFTSTGWGFAFYYNDKLYGINYDGAPSNLYINFIDQLLVLTPIRKPDFWEFYMKYLKEKGYEPGRQPLDE